MRHHMLMAASNNQFTLADINLASGEFTDAAAAAKGWVDGFAVSWQTTAVRLATVLNQIAFPGYIQNVNVTLQIGTQYTFRVFLSSKGGGGSPAVAFSVRDSAGFYASSSGSTTGQWYSINFTPDEELNTFTVSAYNPTNTDSTVTISAVQVFET